MNSITRAVASIATGVVAFLLVALAVTELLAPYVWPSAFLGLPAGIVAGVAAIAVTYFGLELRDERAARGAASAKAVTRFWASVAGVLGFVAVGSLAMAVVASQAVGMATAMVFVGFPAGVVGAVVAAFVVAKRVRANPPRGGTAAQ